MSLFNRLSITRYYWREDRKSPKLLSATYPGNKLPFTQHFSNPALDLCCASWQHNQLSPMTCCQTHPQALLQTFSNMLIITNHTRVFKIKELMHIGLKSIELTWLNRLGCSIKVILEVRQELWIYANHNGARCRCTIVLLRIVILSCNRVGKILSRPAYLRESWEAFNCSLKPSRINNLIGKSPIWDVSTINNRNVRVNRIESWNMCLQKRLFVSSTHVVKLPSTTLSSLRPFSFANILCSLQLLT